MPDILSNVVVVFKEGALKAINTRPFPLRQIYDRQSHDTNCILSSSPIPYLSNLLWPASPCPVTLYVALPEAGRAFTSQLISTSHMIHRAT